MVELNNKIAELTRQERLLAELKQQGLVDPDLFLSCRNGLAEQLRAVKLEKERLLADEEDQTLQQTQNPARAPRSGSRPERRRKGAQRGMPARVSRAEWTLRR